MILNPPHLAKVCNSGELQCWRGHHHQMSDFSKVWKITENVLTLCKDFVLLDQTSRNNHCFAFLNDTVNVLLLIVRWVPLFLCCDWSKNVGGTHTALIKAWWVSLGYVLLLYRVREPFPLEAAAVSVFLKESQHDWTHFEQQTSFTYSLTLEITWDDFPFFEQNGEWWNGLKFKNMTDVFQRSMCLTSLSRENLWTLDLCYFAQRLLGLFKHNWFIVSLGQGSLSGCWSTQKILFFGLGSLAGCFQAL